MGAKTLMLVKRFFILPLWYMGHALELLGTVLRTNAEAAAESLAKWADKHR
jgi:hypothetical protein